MNKNKVSKSAISIRSLIDKAVESGEITHEKYDKITHIATKYNNIDPQERVLLAKFHDLLGNKTIKFKKS